MRAFNLFLVLFLIACSTRPVESAKTNEYFWDFGKVKEGEILKYTFNLKNPFSYSFNIKKIDTSCGCTASYISANNVPAGGSIPVEVKFDTHGYKGKVRQYVWVYTDTKELPLIKITVEAEVIE